MRNFPFTLLILFLVGCTNGFDDGYTTSNSGREADENWIFETADSAFRVFYPTKSRSNSLSEKKLAVVTNGLSRSGDCDTILSIVNYAENEGFVVIDNNHKEILAVSDNGEIEPDEIENPGIRIFLSKAVDYSLNNRNGRDTIIEINDSTSMEYQDFVEPRCPYPWGQEFPAGELCPNKIAGCGPIALAIALTYFEKPKRMVMKHTNSSIPMFIDWKNMKYNVDSYRYSDLNANQSGNYPDGANSESLIQNQKANLDLAHVCREIGYRANAFYLNNGTLTNFYDIYFTAIRLDSTLCVGDIYESYPKAASLIKKDGIIYVAGRAQHYNESIGHCWVIDGYKTEFSFIKDTGSLSGMSVKRIEYPHINWGWYGECNGYYHSGVFSEDGVKEYDFPELDNSLSLCFDMSLMYFTIKNCD